MRKVCYISGTRADFGLMKNVLVEIDRCNELSLDIIVTGMHLLADYGYTFKEIENTGLKITSRIPVTLAGRCGDEMSVAIGEQVIGFTHALKKISPDLILLLGDRGEMLAGAISGLHLNIPIVHIHGGELSGTVDEPVRHAISKLSHFHFTATNQARERLIKMGENDSRVFVTGAPGLDEIVNANLRPPVDVCSEYNLDPARPFSLVLFHPVVQHAADAGNQFSKVFNALIQSGGQYLIIRPNADAGGAAINSVIDGFRSSSDMHIVTHLSRIDFLSLLQASEMLIGNSSSGIIEAASLGTRVVNIGDRQRSRERNANVIDVQVDVEDIYRGIIQSRKKGVFSGDNVYGDGNSASRIVELLSDISLNSSVLDKINAY
ncbi:UDP-N-acetylglucosamine 2-epimerase [uncultured Amphritea sp.]|uniref:UDP-N-acetylglucosamine 2-epimerase n=1 Tax=uncultured Amphritea sp. TaxID=981605 RepID=UPI0026229146|nr:UDP-N-acetylglucosamine 2-epimerase [uncultured Amphritea sp.]